MPDVDIPPYNELIWPTIVALRQLGGSGSNEEIVKAVLEIGRYTEEQQSVLHKNGPGTALGYRAAWARSYLKGMDLVTNSQRGVWSLTDEGRKVQEIEIEPLYLKYRADYSRTRRNQTPTQVEEMASRSLEKDLVEPAEESTWEEQLLDFLMGMEPSSFERLVQRLLREAGFLSTQVTGRTGDGGIDGLGVYRMSLLSFPVFFQCKRYRGSVGSGAVRDFRGALAGRGDKGLLITTGTFTSSAENEARRDGAPPVDLIDGHRLCELLKEYGLGVETTIKTIEDVKVHKEFFADL